MKTLDYWVDGDWFLNDAKLEEIASLLRELVKWSKFGGKHQIKIALIDSLKTDPEKLVFEFSDGQRSVRDIERISSVNRSSILQYWKKWFKLGILEKSHTYAGRMKHICSMEDVGLDVPQVGPSEPEIQPGEPDHQAVALTEEGDGRSTEVA